MDGYQVKGKGREKEIPQNLIKKVGRELSLWSAECALNLQKSVKK